VVDVGMLEFCIREELNRTALRRMAVLRPLKVVIENYPEGQLEELEAVNHPDNPAAGMRRIAFGRELFIERDDFMENPPKKFFRLSPGNEVRLRYAYFIKCHNVVKNPAGEVVELRCTYDPATKGGNAPDGRKVKATMHWVSAADAISAEVRLYNPLFAKPDPSASDFAADLNPNSLGATYGEHRLKLELSDADWYRLYPSSTNAWGVDRHFSKSYSPSASAYGNSVDGAGSLNVLWCDGHVSRSTWAALIANPYLTSP